MKFWKSRKNGILKLDNIILKKRHFGKTEQIIEQDILFDLIKISFLLDVFVDLIRTFFIVYI